MRVGNRVQAHSFVAASLVAVSLLVLAAAACGGAATRPGGADFVRRHLPDAVLARKGIAYSGYRTGQSPDLQLYPEKAQILEDLQLLIRGGWGFIRLFDCGPHAERVLAVIAENDLDLQVMLGVWISGTVALHDASNRDQIQRCLALIDAHGELVAAVSVGNETLDDWSNVRLPPAELVVYIEEVRERVALPVTTDDSWLPFMLGSDGATSYADVILVAQAVDFLSLHVYAFADAFYDGWEWKQESVPMEQRGRAMMDAAIAFTKASIRDVRATLAARGLDVPILIGEMGWKSFTPFTATAAPEDAIEAFLAHPVNQKMFYDAVMSWVYGSDKDADAPIGAFYFEAFDEPWKDGDDNWGLFDVERQPKYLIWDVFPELVPAGAPAYTDADAVCYVAAP